MRWFARVAAALAVVILVAACAVDAPTSAPDAPSEAVLLENAQADIFWTKGCPRIGSISILAAAILFTDRDAARYVLGGLGDLDSEIRRNRKARWQAIAHRLVDYLLARHAAGKFRGTDAQLSALINAIYCSAGIDLSLDDPDNTVLVLPTDGAQVATNGDGNAGLSLPAGAVTEPTLLTIEVVPDTFPTSGDGLLDTKLDQYPGFIVITKQSEGDQPLAQPVVVGVCADGVIPQEVRDRLRLGHGATAGFQLAPPAPADFLVCPNEVASAGPQPLWQRLASLIAPKAAHASSAVFAGGGVGGTVTEFSPFAPVDPQLSFSGGVGGTVTEFIRETAPVSLTSAATEAMVTDCTLGAVGAPVAPECRPAITVTTRLGTLLSGVPVQWNITAGGGTVAPRTTFCGTYGSTAATTTNVLGRAAVCWNLGAVGANSVTATPGVGGDAPAGVTFDPAEVSFTITAVSGEAVGIEKVQGPDAAPAGTVATPDPTVRAFDASGNPVAGVTVNWFLFTSGGSLSVASSVTGADGRASVQWTMGAGYQNLLAWVKHEAPFTVTFEATGTTPP